ncbi:MAG: hypothetical protein ACJAS4_001767 [Bacteriovoracaceae bacterium]|jgi:hypothetical protein
MFKLVIYFIFFISQSFASIIPLNELLIPKTMKANISELQFNQLIDKVIKPYKEDILNHYKAKDFVINRLWDNEKVNASASIRENVYSLKIYGGLARFAPLTQDGFTLVLCHELGHLIGGAPTWKPYNISSSEGQADYFATLKCFRRINQNETLIINEDQVHPLALKKCKNSFAMKHEYQLCLRSALAQDSLTETITQLADLAIKPNRETPDPYVRMFILFNGYPSPQCRLDTMFSGSLCQNDINELMDKNLYNKGTCFEKNGDVTGLRPKCWYVERED